MKTLTKMAKINFFRTLEISQRLPTIWGVFIQEKLLNLIKQGLWHCNLNCSHLPLLRSAVTLKTSSLANMVLVKTSCLKKFGAPQKVTFPEHCPYLTCLQLPGKAPFAGHCYHLALIGDYNLLTGKAISPGQLFSISAAEGTYQLGK